MAQVDVQFTAPREDRAWLPLQMVFTLLMAGGLGTLAFGIFGQGIAPLLGLSKLAPVPLAGSVFKTVAGFKSSPAAHLLHYFAGMVAYPFAFYLVGRPLWQKLAPWMPWVVVAVLFGVLQWVFAVYVMAHLVAGMPPFLKWSGITYAALYGHILYALVAIGFTTYFRVTWRSAT